MEEITLQCSVRSEIGKEANRKLRRSGKIPAVMYGHGKETVSLEIDPKEVFRILHSQSGENTLFQVSIPGRDHTVCMIKEYQLEPVSHQLLHADLYEVAMDEMLEVDVPLVTKGEAYGVKTEGGLLDIIHRELRVECLPADIPEHIEVDITDLKVGSLLRVKDITVSDKIQILDDPETVVLAIEHPRVEETVEAAAPGAEEEAEPEVIKKGKAEEEEEEED